MEKELLHYAMTLEFYRATRGYVDRKDFENRPNPLCGNGSFHAKTTRDFRLITCPECKAKYDKLFGEG